MSGSALPPAIRSRSALRMTAAAAVGRFELQVCTVCAAVQYPPREACHRCLARSMRWILQSGAGELLSDTTLSHSHDPYFSAHLPWRIGLVRLDAGVTVIAHLHSTVQASDRVRIVVRLDRVGQATLIALPGSQEVNLSDDPQLREMTWDVRGRSVLVTDGDSGLGRELIRQLFERGAQTVWAGRTNPAADPLHPAPASLQMLDLNLHHEGSVARTAERIGPHLDILINNTEWHGDGSDMLAARAAMEINYFGLLRLAEHFGPRLRERAASVPQPLVWVNLLSVLALGNFSAGGTLGASKAAALSLSQWLRADMAPSGVRVANVFAGGQDDPAVLAQAMLEGLRDTIEDLFPGDFAQQWRARWLESPKTLEREIAGQARAAP